MIPAIAWEPVQTLHQLRCQLNTARIDLEAPLEDLAAATVNIKETAGRLHIEDIAPLIFYLFKTAAPALFAVTVPISRFRRTVIHILFLTPLFFLSHHIRQRSHTFRGIITLTAKFG